LVTQTKRDANGLPILKTLPEGGMFMTEQKIDPYTNTIISEKDIPYVKPTFGDIEPQDKNPNLSGIQYLKTLPVGEQALVKAIGEGRTRFSQVTSYRGVQRKQLAEKVARAYPTYDQRWIDASYNLAKDATTGNIAKNARSLNTAIGHLEQFDTAAKQLNNVDFTGYNSLANWIRSHTGDPRVIAVETAAKALKSELASAVKGGASGAAGTEQEIKDWGQVFDKSMSQAQFDSAVNATIKVLGSRISALNNQIATLPPQYAGLFSQFDVISPPARQILESYGFDFQKYMRGTKSSPDSTPSPKLSPEDQEAIDWAKANPKDPRAIKILQIHGIK
jgi:hypothetical protein